MNSVCKHLIFSWPKILNRANYRLINFDNKNKLLRMNEAYFKHLVDDRKIAISFRFVQDLDAKKLDRIFNFVRDIDEDVSVSMNRIKNNLEKELLKKVKKGKKKQPTVDETELHESLQVRLKKISPDYEIQDFLFLGNS